MIILMTCQHLDSYIFNLTVEKCCFAQPSLLFSHMDATSIEPPQCHMAAFEASSSEKAMTVYSKTFLFN